MSELQKYTIETILVGKDGYAKGHNEAVAFYPADDVDAASAADKARIEELERHLKTSNGNVEHFERLFYLEQQKTEDAHGRIELLQRAVEEIAKPLPSVPSAALAAGYKSQQLASQTLADIIKAVKP